MANRFKQAAPKAKKLYKTGRYKTFADAMKAALGSTKPAAKKRAPVKKRAARSTRPKKAARAAGHKKVSFAGGTISGHTSSLRKLYEQDLANKIIKRDLHTKGVRDKRKLTKQISEIKTKLRRL